MMPPVEKLVIKTAPTVTGVVCEVKNFLTPSDSFLHVDDSGIQVTLMCKKKTKSTPRLPKKNPKKKQAQLNFAFKLSDCKQDIHCPNAR